MRITLFVVLNLMIAGAGLAQTADKINFATIGQIKPRDAKAIQASPWSVGAETMDRDYIRYEHWREYLGPLGVKKARIQSGWAKTEKVKGVYDWHWLDAIIPDMVARGVEPWVDLCYGNRIYTGGGGTTLADKELPSSKEAIDAWIRYVKAIVVRYKEYVDEWEVWNEPNYRIDAKQYADFLVMTAEAVKSVQPKAQILGIALGSWVDYEYADKVLGYVAAQDKIHLIDQITHHRHRPIPEENQSEIELEKVLDKYSENLIARQGEAGCPSEYSTDFALKNMPWSELTQTKHVLRRMMTDFGHGKETSVFLIVDARYIRNGKVVWNRKGLLRANHEQKVVSVKPAYRAVQHVTAIFDSTLQRIVHYPYEVKLKRPMSLYGIENKHSGRQIVVLWFDDQIPAESNQKKPIDLVLYHADFVNPVYVDLRTGEVYAIPEQHWNHAGSVYRFNNIPVYDSPVLIAEKRLVPLDLKSE